MQDAAINSTNTIHMAMASAAPASGWTALNNAGRYEYVVATSAAGARFRFAARVPAMACSTPTQMPRLPERRANDVSRLCACHSIPARLLVPVSRPRRWDGTTGGILVFDVAGNLALGRATVNLNGMGFRGGGARQLSGGAAAPMTDYVNLATNNFHGARAKVLPARLATSLTARLDSVVDTGVEGYPNGSFARGAPGNAGGGGTDGDMAANDENSGGGGGGNWGAGGQGGRTWDSNLDRGGHGGAAFTSAAANRVIMGGGGGAGSRNNSSGTMSSGGAGGGIVMIRAATISGSGTISANGADGLDADNDGGGGGGAGGSVVVVANSGGLGTLTINARGGDGRRCLDHSSAGRKSWRAAWPRAVAGVASSLSPALRRTNVTGGNNGITTTAADPFGATDWANAAVLSISCE